MDTKSVSNPNYVGGFSNPTSEMQDTGEKNVQNQPPGVIPYPTQNPTGVYPPQEAYPSQGPYPPQGAYPPQDAGKIEYQQQGAQVPPAYPGPPMILQPQPIEQNIGGPPPYNSIKPTVDVEAGASGVADVIISMDNKDIRLAFTRKVFAILALQMAVTVGMSALFMFQDSIRYKVQSSMGAYISAYVIFLVLLIVLTCCSGIARSHPTNIILLGLLTLSMGYMVGVISCFHATNIVILAFGITFFCTIAVMLFACQTKYDLTSCSGAMFCLLCAFILFGIFAGILVPKGIMTMAHCAYSGLGALLYMAFLAMDTQYIIGGRQFELNPDEYVFAALQLYMDIILVFLYIISKLLEKSK